MSSSWACWQFIALEMLCFLVLVSSSCPPRYLKVLIVNDFARVQELGSEGANLHSQRTFSQMQNLFSQAEFSCAINLTLVGQVNFVSGPPSAVTPRYCNTSWPAFQNSHPVDSAPCCTLQDRSSCFEGASTCVGNSYRYDKNMVGCFDVTSSRLFQDRSITLIELGGFLTNNASRIDGFQYATDFTKYVFNDQVSTLQGMFDNFHVALLFSGTTFAGNPVSAKTATLCNSWAGAAISAPSLSPIYLASLAANAVGLTFGLGIDAGCNVDKSLCSARSKPCLCPSCGYIMGTQARYFAPDKFSSCSISQMNAWFDNDMLTTAGGCLRASPRAPSSTLCGNGIVDPGEQCDQSFFGAGGSACCDMNCNLRLGCQCASGTCCGSNNQLLRGVTCRPSKGACDTAELCSGGAECPPDSFLASGTVCGQQQTGRCYVGQCVDPLLLCPSVVGLDASSQSLCSTAGTCTTFECFGGYGYNGGGAQTASCVPYSVANAGAVDGVQCGFSSGSQCLAGKCVASSQITFLAGTGTATPNPTKLPTNVVTLMPTRSRAPSPFPSFASSRPTTSVEVTSLPTRAPTLYPSSFPTPFPSMPPIFFMPTPPPTNRMPTPFPSPFPSLFPTRFSTPLPTPFSPAQTPFPTPFPTPLPTPRVVILPTARPTTPMPTSSSNPRLGRNGDLWILCPEDVIVPLSNLPNSALVDYPAPSVGQEGGIPEVRVVGPGPLSMVPFGITTVLLIATSSTNSDQQATCTFQIRVVDQTPPIITCPSFIDVVLAPGTQQTTVTYSIPTCTDNRGCEIRKLAGPFSGEQFSRGSTRITYRASDVAGNSVECTFNVRVRDANSAYFIICPSDLEFTLPQGETRVTVQYPTPIGSNGTTPTLITGGYSGQVLQLGNYTIVWQLGTDVCSFLIRVSSPGALVCPTSVQKDIGSMNASSAIVEYSVNTTDGSRPILIRGFPSGYLFPFGSTSITYTAPNNSRCSFNVVVRDETSPVIVCPRNIYGYVVRAQNCAPVSYVPPTITNTRPGYTLTSVGLPSGGCFPLGSSRVAFTVTSTSNLTDSCTMLITVLQQFPPLSISCPFDITRRLRSSNYMTVTYPLPAVSNGAAPNLVSGFASGAEFSLGVTRITYESAPNVSCSFLVNLIDDVPPLISCPTAISQPVLNPQDQTAQVFYPLPEASDVSGIASFKVIEGYVSGSFFPIGVTVVTIQVADASNNTASCTFRIAVFVDRTRPGNSVGVCPNNVTASLLNESNQVPVFYATPISNNLHAATLVEGLSSGASFPFGLTKVTYMIPTFMQYINCSFYVEVVDKTSPSIRCPSTITRTSVAGTGMTVLYTRPTATDNRPTDFTLDLIQGLPSGAVFSPGGNLVVYQAVDASNNIAVCSFWIFIVSLGQPDYVSCPSDVTATLRDPNSSTVTVNYPPVAASDGAIPILREGLANGDSFPVGITTQRFAHPVSGNSCVFRVIVGDGVPPVIVCPSDRVTALTSQNDLLAQVAYPEPTATDNLPGVLIQRIVGLPSGGYFRRGASTVQYMATDAGGLTAMCSFQVNVVTSDEITINCPRDVIVPITDDALTIVVNYPLPSVTDNSSPQFYQGLGSGAVFPVGNTSIAYRSWNNKNCSFAVTVTREYSPLFVTCPFSFAVNLPATASQLPIFYDLPTAQDYNGGSNVEVSLLQGLLPGSQFPLGATPIRYVAWDNVTHVSTTCNFTITIRRGAAVILSCPSTIKRFSNEELVVKYNTPIASDGSSVALRQGYASGSLFPVGITRVGWYVQQNAQVTCEFDVILSRTMLLVCPADVRVILRDNALLSAFATYPSPLTSAGVVYTLKAGDVPSNSFFPRGSTSINFLTPASSIAGTRNCSFVVRVTVIADCPRNMIFELGVNENQMIVNYNMPSVPAGLRLALTEGLPSGSLFPVGNTTITYSAFNNIAVAQDTCRFIITVGSRDWVRCPKSFSMNNTSVTIPAPTIFNRPRAVLTLQGAPPSNVYTYGVYSLTYVARDVTNNETASCNFVVSIIDPRLPSIVCPANLYRPLVNPFLSATRVSYPGPSVLNSSILIELVSGPANNSYFPVGVTTVTFSATNSLWYTAYCSFNITVIETNSLVCPSSNISVSGSLLPNATGAQVSFPVPSTLDGSPAILIAGKPPGSVFPFGVTTVIYQVANLDPCIFSVIVRDIRDAGLTCPSNITLIKQPQAKGATVTYALPAVFNSKNVTLRLIRTSGYDSGSFFPPGSTLVTYTVLDSLQRLVAQCLFEVFIADRTPPFLSCPSPVVAVSEEEGAGVNVTYSLPTVSNAPSGLSPLLESGYASGNFFPFGLTVVTYKIVSGGLTHSCSFPVYVSDDSQLPTLICPSNIDKFIEVGGNTKIEYGQPAIANNVQNFTVYLVEGLPNNFAFPLGTTRVGFVLIGSLEQVQCTFNVTLHTMPLSAQCPEDMRVSLFTNPTGVIVNYKLNSPFDLSLVSGLPSGSFFPMGTSVVSFNSSALAVGCSFSIIVADRSPPELACIDSLSVPLGSWVNFELPSAWDFIDGSTNVFHVSGPLPEFVATRNTVTVFASRDRAGNQATCSVNVTVVASDRPVGLICPPSQAVTATTNRGTTVIYALPAVWPESSEWDISLIQGPLSGSVFPLGVSFIEYRALRQSVIETCNFTIVVSLEGQASTCFGQCGKKVGSCWCDSSCNKTNDCCPDQPQFCGAVTPVTSQASCSGNCGLASDGCLCDSECEKYNDCCYDYKQQCGVGSTPVSLPGSCARSCIGRSTNSTGGCHCDASCVKFGDCCQDRAFYCSGAQIQSSCQGLCGQRPTGAIDTCWCDETCIQHGDCCSDFQLQCGAQLPSVRRGSCAGYCGLKSTECYCDIRCRNQGDCCEDYASLCES